VAVLRRTHRRGQPVQIARIWPRTKNGIRAETSGSFFV
jgi:hypothetical protein